jgi:DnaJ-class molecular chaperone
MGKKGFMDGYRSYDTSQGYGNAKQWRNAFQARMSKDEAEAILRDETESPYSILGVSPGATKDQIKKAFRKKITEWHPDKNQYRVTEAEAMSKKIIAAYTALTND